MSDKLNLLVDRVKVLNYDRKSIVRDVFKAHESELKPDIERHLDKGLNSDGTVVLPRYTEDPYFKGNMERVEKYLNWKERKFGVQRTEGANLIITGAFRNSLFIHINKDGLTVDSNYVGKSLNGHAVVERYDQANNGKTFLPSEDYMEHTIKPAIIEIIQKRVLGL